MSHFTRIKTQIADLSCLIQALNDLGYTEIETGIQIHLFGWHGDDRAVIDTGNPNYAPPCEVAIRRKYLGSASNDIGFILQPDGTYEAIISDYDQTALKGWIDKVTQRYALNVVKQNAQYSGYQVVEEEVQSTGTIRLLVQKW